MDFSSLSEPPLYRMAIIMLNKLTEAFKAAGSPLFSATLIKDGVSETVRPVPSSNCHNSYSVAKVFTVTAIGLLFDEVEVGRLYIIYITNHAGLYRYRVGDIVEITDIKDGIPYFRYIGRTNERIHESGIYHSIQKLSAISNTPIYDYCFYQNEEGSLTLYIESEASDSIINCDPANSLSDKLHIETIKQIPIGTQEDYKILRGSKGNMAADQLKPIRSLNSREKREFFKPKAK